MRDTEGLQRSRHAAKGKHREGGKKKEKGSQISDQGTSSLTLTSAFLLRRLLAAAERQKETPSDGRVHIIHLRESIATSPDAAHAAERARAGRKVTCSSKRHENLERSLSDNPLMSKSGFSRIEGRTEKKMGKKKKSGLNLALPLKKKKETLPPSHKKKDIKTPTNKHRRSLARSLTQSHTRRKKKIKSPSNWHLLTLINWPKR